MPFAERMPRTRRIAFLMLLPMVAQAQTGRISGTVTDAAGSPLAGAQVLLPALGLAAQSRDSGVFTMKGVPAGTHDLKVFRIGYKPWSGAGVTVSAGGDARVAIQLERAIVQLQSVVVGASRHAEKITDAAASITSLDVALLENRIGNSVEPVLRDAPGLDVTQVGITSMFVNGRGFNARFNTRWLTIEDGRIATLAETGLPIGEHTTIPKIDVGAVEVLVGPSSALYGANASNGLLSVRTKDPREYPGFSAEMSGGSRSFKDLQARYAGSTGHLGYKIAGEYQSANDWTDTIYYPSTKTPAGAALPETIAKFDTRNKRVSGSLIYYLNDDAKVQLTSGISKRDGLGDSQSGHYQIANYVYSNHQIQYTSARWFAQAYLTHSNSGDTYQMYLAVPSAERNPTLSLDSIRQLTRFHADGRVYAAEIQNNLLIGNVAHTGLRAIDNTQVTWGGQIRRTRISSYNTIFTDVLTLKPFYIDSKGVYAQVESPLTASVRLVAAARLDADARYDRQVSPRISALYTPVPDQTVRLTYGEAFRSPPPLATDVFGQAVGGARNVGDSHGFIIKDSTGTIEVSRISQLVPEINKTWELGYKAVLGARLFVDVTAYRSTFEHFISGGLVIADPNKTIPGGLYGVVGTRAYDATTGALIDDGKGKAVRVQTNYNLGEGIADGIDAGIRFYFTDKVAIASSLALKRLDTIKVRPTDPKDVGQFNTSLNRSSLSLELTDIFSHLGAVATARYAQGYPFRSGVVWGHTPSFGVFDLSANYRFPGQNTTLMLQAQNIFSCLGGVSTPPVTGLSSSATATYAPGRECGFGLRHRELIDMPAIGTMVFVGVRREWR